MKLNEPSGRDEIAAGGFIGSIGGHADGQSRLVKAAI